MFTREVTANGMLKTAHCGLMVRKWKYWGQVMKHCTNFKCEEPCAITPYQNLWSAQIVLSLSFLLVERVIFLVANRRQSILICYMSCCHSSICIPRVVCILLENAARRFARVLVGHINVRCGTHSNPLPWLQGSILYALTMRCYLDWIFPVVPYGFPTAQLWRMGRILSPH